MIKESDLKDGISAIIPTYKGEKYINKLRRVQKMQYLMQYAFDKNTEINIIASDTKIH